MDETKKYTEDELVALLQSQDTQAFSYLYDNYAPALNNIIFRMVEDVPLSEDILQEAFIKIWNNFTSYDSTKGRLFTWMLNLTRNLTIDTLRSKGYKKQSKISGDENTVSNLQDNAININKFDSLGIRKKLANLGVLSTFKHTPQLGLFHGLADQLDQKHPLYQLANKIIQ